MNPTAPSFSTLSIGFVEEYDRLWSVASGLDDPSIAHVASGSAPRAIAGVPAATVRVESSDSR